VDDDVKAKGGVLKKRKKPKNNRTGREKRSLQKGGEGRGNYGTFLDQDFGLATDVRFTKREGGASYQKGDGSGAPNIKGARETTSRSRIGHRGIWASKEKILLLFQSRRDEKRRRKRGSVEKERNVNRQGEAAFGTS